jgi:hypothetical protein
MCFEEINPVEQHLELFEPYLARRFFALRPGEPILLQFLLPETKTISIPVDDLYQLMLSITEQKQAFGERIVLHGVLNQNAQSVYAFSKISLAGTKEKPVFGKIQNHDVSPITSRTDFRVCRSKPF